jgi:hypothetical protein
MQSIDYNSALKAGGFLCRSYLEKAIIMQREDMFTLELSWVV